MKETTLSALQTVGLSRLTALLYTTLLRRGPSLVSDIVRTSKLHRPQVYRGLADLQERGLVSVIPRGRRRLYLAAPPGRLAALASEAQGTLAKVIPLLEVAAGRGRPGGIPEVQLLEGIEAIRTIFDDIVSSLPRGATFYRFTSRAAHRVDRYLPRDYRQRRDAKQLKRLVITNEERSRLKRPSLNRSTRTIPKGEAAFLDDLILLIYGSTIALIDDVHDVAIVIRDRRTASFFRSIFLVMFRRLPESGLVGNTPPSRVYPLTRIAARR